MSFFLCFISIQNNMRGYDSVEHKLYVVGVIRKIAKGDG